MAKCSDKKNPLQRSGTAQSERLLPGLQNGYVNVDEKTFADWIVFAKEFAHYLTYYELNGAPNGDWSPFFSSDVSAVLGTIAIQDVEVYKRSIKDRLDFLKKNEHAGILNEVKEKLNDLFSIILSYCLALEEFYRLLPGDVDLKSGIENIIKNRLAPALNRFLGYYKPAVQEQLNFLRTGNFTNLKVIGEQVKDAKHIIDSLGLSNLWWVQPKPPQLPYTSWKDYYDGIKEEAGIYGLPAWVEFLRIQHAANHNLFSGVFDQFLMAYSKLVKDAEKDLLQSLENRDSHPAHYALFLAFLRLFRFAQDDINTITRRHLDFYYKEILQLRQRAALPNKAHIITELAKPVDSYIMKEETLLKAGKDSGGREVLYASVKEETFNKAKIKSLRSVYFGTVKDNHAVNVNNEGRIFAAPMINSADGIKAELATPNKEWHPIVNRLYTEGKVIDIKMPLAEIGFAIASHYLYLQEGVRRIMVRLATSNNEALKSAGDNNAFSLYITTEKDWYKISSVVGVIVNTALNKGTEQCTEFSFTLAGDEPPVTIYDAAVHGGTLNVAVPVLKMILINDDTRPYDNTLRDILINKIEVAVEVGMAAGYNQQGLKQLLVSTDGGIVDTSKPFQPFGGQPRKDTTLVIGNKEAFSKKNARIKLNIEWGGLPVNQYDINYNTTYGSTKRTDDTYIFYATTSATPYYPTIKPQFLADGSWNDNNGDNTVMNPVDIFNGIDPKVQIFATSQSLHAKTITDFFLDDYTFAADSVNGFMRLVLNGDFGHKKYLSDLTYYLLEKNKSPYYQREVGVLPIEPYTPIIQSLYMSYSAFSDVIDLTGTTERAFNSKQAGFFHLYPFGDGEQHAFLNKETSQYLLPQFNHRENSLPIHHEGEFYIGLENLTAKQSVNVLFQVMDGTADPTISKPAEHIRWSYLSNNKWKDFKKQDISDATLQLIRSGIISFIIPADATTINTIMPTGFLWIKASVIRDSDAICKLLSVDAQAAVVTFKDNGNAGDFLDNALPADTISKLKIPQSAIKKITQPYSSFGGRPLENSEAFYSRVSERLRHKARAVAIWDYEHLILEAFPLIHKVKCLNHTKSVDSYYDEVVPGHVTIITIPDLRQRNDINPLKPYTSQGMLQTIDIFLRKKISCHIQLHVVNPDFEEVEMAFELKLAKGFDDFTLYANKLKEEITSFLSPWAYGEGQINFGGKIYKSVLINFIEERNYVDFITLVKMSHYAADGSSIKPDNDEITASTSKSILVSRPASAHTILQYPTGTNQ